jgi:hypothetical protein
VLKDVTISGDGIVVKKEAGNVSKYKYLAIEIQHMRSAKTDVMSLIIEATGTISNSFRKHPSNSAKWPAENGHIGHRTHASESTM